MLKPTIALFFAFVFLLFLSLPVTLIVLDKKAEVVLLIDFNTEEELGEKTLKDLEILSHENSIKEEGLDTNTKNLTTKSCTSYNSLYIKNNYPPPEPDFS